MQTARISSVFSLMVSLYGNCMFSPCVEGFFSLPQLKNLITEKTYQFKEKTHLFMWTVMEMFQVVAAFIHPFIFYHSLREGGAEPSSPEPGAELFTGQFSSLSLGHI